MTRDLEALFQAVVRDPDADAPRLAFADACEAQDPERAEFIRLQVGHAAALRASRQDDADRGAQREIFLEKRRADGWAGPIRDRVERVHFYRGFVESVEVDAQRFLDEAEQLYALAPIRRLKLTGVASVLEEVCNSPHLARIVSLAFDNEKIGDRAAELLAASPHVSKLAHLWLARCGITAKGVEALAASSMLSSLRSVDGLPDEFKEIVWSDQGQTINVLPPPAAPAIEEKYGYKRWLHEMQETRWQGVRAAEL